MSAPLGTRYEMPDRDDRAHENRARRGRAYRFDMPPPRDRSADPWASVCLSTPRVVPGIWTWLRAALRDVGYPVSGWSFGRDDDTRFEIQLKGHWTAVVDEITCLWDNEKPGVPLTISRR